MSHEEHESLRTWFISTTSDLRGRSNRLKPILLGVQLLQFFISRRLYKPEAGDDAPRQGAGNENTCPGPEALNEYHDHCGDPDNGQCHVQNYVVYANYEFFHVYSLFNDCPLTPYARASGQHDRYCGGATATGKFAGDTYTSASEGLTELRTSAGTAISDASARAGRAFNTGTEAIGNAALSGATRLGELAQRSGLRQRPAPATGGEELV
jgi:hypothetical protein